MAATYLPYLTDGLRIRYSSGSGDAGTLRVTVPGHVQDIPDPGGTPIDLLAAAMAATGVPQPGSKLVILGREVFAREYDIGAWANFDAELTITYVSDPASFNGSASEEEVGTTTELGETDFDAENQLKPFNERQPMYVIWNPAVDGASVDDVDFRVGVRLPTYINKPYRRYTKVIGTDPGPLSEQFAHCVNRVTWKGYPPETVLCLSIVGSNTGDGWRTTFDFAIDRTTKWRQVFRVTDPDTGEYVPLTQAQVAGTNGIKDFLTQPTIDFNALPL